MVRRALCGDEYDYSTLSGQIPLQDVDLNLAFARQYHLCNGLFLIQTKSPRTSQCYPNRRWRNGLDGKHMEVLHLQTAVH